MAQLFVSLPEHKHTHQIHGKSVISVGEGKDLDLDPKLYEARRQLYHQTHGIPESSHKTYHAHAEVPNLLDLGKQPAQSQPLGDALLSSSISSSSSSASSSSSSSSSSGVSEKLHQVQTTKKPIIEKVSPLYPLTQIPIDKQSSIQSAKDILSTSYHILRDEAQKNKTDLACDAIQIAADATKIGLEIAGISTNIAKNVAVAGLHTTKRVMIDWPLTVTSTAFNIATAPVYYTYWFLKNSSFVSTSKQRLEETREKGHEWLSVTEDQAKEIGRGILDSMNQGAEILRKEVPEEEGDHFGKHHKHNKKKKEKLKERKKHPHSS